MSMSVRVGSSLQSLRAVILEVIMEAAIVYIVSDYVTELLLAAPYFGGPVDVSVDFLLSIL